MAKTVKWEAKLNEARKLLGASRSNLFDVVTMLKEVYDDPAFLGFHDNKIDLAEEYLDELLTDYELSFGDALMVLKYYPARDQWLKTGLRTMLAESMSRRDAESDKKATTRTRATVSKKEYEAVQKALEQEQSRVKSLAAEVADIRSEREKLREENRELTRQLARAEGRISELERMLKGELAAA